MPKYLCLQRSLPADGADQPSPDEMQEMYSRFNDWRTKFQHNLVDLGGQLGAGRLVASGPVADGTFATVDDMVGGYMIVSADTLEEAIEVATGGPGLVRPGSGGEVIEILGP